MKKNARKIDPRNTAAGPWGFWLCLNGQMLAPERCRICCGNRFSKDPGKIINPGCDNVVRHQDCRRETRGDL